MERNRGHFGFLSLSAAALAAWLLMVATASTAEAGVSVRVIQVRASNKGKEFVDPALGDLGERLKKRFPYKNFRKVGEDTRQGDIGDALRYDLADGNVLNLTLVALKEKVVTMQMVVEKLLNTKVRARLGAIFMIALPWNGDLLILAVTPSD